MTVKSIRSFGVVLDGIEKSRVVSRPVYRDRFFDLLRAQLSGPEVLDLEGVLAKSGVVGGIGQEVAVVTHVVGSKRHELLTLGELVDIERDLFRRVKASFLPAHDRILLSFLGA